MDERQKDALAHEHVLGYEGVGQGIGTIEDTDWYDADGLPVPSYGTDMHAAKRLQNAIRQQDWETIQRPYMAAIREAGSAITPMLIRDAALKAVGVEL